MSYYARQQDACSLEALQIAELIRDGARFADWPQVNREILVCALFPEVQQDENGRWTVEGRMALNLIRHLFKRGHFINAPKVLVDIKDHLSQQEKGGYDLGAFHVRHELINLTPPWMMDRLL